jgi:hypothetical protein
MQKETKTLRKPRAKLIGADSNVFNLLGIASAALRKGKGVAQDGTDARSAFGYFADNEYLFAHRRGRRDRGDQFVTGNTGSEKIRRRVMQTDSKQLGGALFGEVPPGFFCRHN